MKIDKSEMRNIILELGDKIFTLDGEVSKESQMIIENMKEELLKIKKRENIN